MSTAIPFQQIADTMEKKPMTDFYDSRFESTPRIGLVGKVGSQARECKWRLFFTFEAWSEQAVDFMNGYLELQPHSSKKDTNDVVTKVMAIKQKKTKIMTRRRKKINWLVSLFYCFLAFELVISPGVSRVKDAAQAHSQALCMPQPFTPSFHYAFWSSIHFSFFFYLYFTCFV